VTGLRQYALPGVLTIDRNSVSAWHGVTIGRTTVNVPASAAGPLTILRPGTRLVGRAMSVTGGILELRLEGAAEPARIPLDSIQTLERRERRARRHVVRGLLVGVGAFFGSGFLAFSRCGLNCDDAAMTLTMFGSGAVAGMLAGRSSPEVWTPVSTSDFVSQFGK
jgi:hypothetical protein